MIKYFLIFSFLYLFSSCSKEKIEPNMYYVQVKNDYFERIDSVKLGNHYIGKIEQGIISEHIFVNKGGYNFSCVTQSELLITAGINIQGLNEKITIKLNKKGKVELE